MFDSLEKFNNEVNNGELLVISYRLSKSDRESGIQIKVYKNPYSCKGLVDKPIDGTTNGVFLNETSFLPSGIFIPRAKLIIFNEKGSKIGWVEIRSLCKVK